MAGDEIGASEQSPSAETDALPHSVPLESDITASQVDRSLLPPPPGTARLGILLTIGDIGITTDSIVTPNGSAPLAGSQWIFTDHTNVEQKIPGWAIILAIALGLACGVGLLFLLVKDTRITGYAEVSVRSESLLQDATVSPQPA